MEAWLAETIVIASGASDVVTWHCERSGGGLVYATSSSSAVLAICRRSSRTGRATCPQGRDYVLANYSAVGARPMERSLEGLL